MALEFLPQPGYLAGLVTLSQSNAGLCCIWNLRSVGMAQPCHEVRLDGENLSCLAVGLDGQLRRDDRKASSPRTKRPSMAGLLTNLESLPNAQIATCGDGYRVNVVELRTEFRCFFDLHDQERQGPQGPAAVAKVLRFAESGRLLAVGDAAGQVHLFRLGRVVQGDGSKAPPHRILALSGEVVDLVLHGEQLLRATCWHPAHVPRQQLDDKSGEDPEGDKVTWLGL